MKTYESIQPMSKKDLSVSEIINRLSQFVGTKKEESVIKLILDISKHLKYANHKFPVIQIENGQQMYLEIKNA